MNRTYDGAPAFKGEMLLKALENTAIHYFSYDVRSGTAEIPPRTCERFKCGPLYKNMPYSFSEDFVLESDIPAFNKLYFDINGGAESSDAMFRNKSGKNWCHATLTTVERDENGIPVRAVGIIEDLSSIKQREQRYSEWIDALGELYPIRCCIDMTTNTYMVVEGKLGLAGHIPDCGDAESAMKLYAESCVFEEDRSEYMNKFSADYIRSHLDCETRSFSYEFRQLNNSGLYNWMRGTAVLVNVLPDGSVHNVLYTAQCIDEEKQEKVLLESSLSLMRDTYYRIGCIDLNKNSMHTITISETEKDDAPFFKEDFDSQIRRFAEDYVLMEYREKFLNIMLPARMKTIFDMGSDYIDITYRRLEDGEPKWVRTELIPLQGYSPQNRLVMWYVKNISHEKAAEEKLSKTLLQVNTDINLQLETILSGISGGFKISRGDEKFTYTYISESAAALFGYSVEEFVRVSNNSASRIVYPPDLEDVLKALEDDLSRGSVYSVKYRVKCKDGSIKWIVDSGKKVAGEDGNTLFYSFYNDVTELEERNMELRNSLTMINQMMRSLNCGIFAYRLPRREILLLNDEAKFLFGWNGSDADINMNRIMRENILPEDIAVMSNAVKSIKEPGGEASYEFRIKHSDGTVCRVQTNSRMLEFDDGSRFILSSMLDITETYELNEIIKEERGQYRDALLTNCEYAYSFDLTDGIITSEYVTKHGINPFRKFNIKLPVTFDEFISEWLEKAEPQFLDKEMVAELSREAMLKKYNSGERSGEVEYYSSVTDSYTRVTSLLSRSERNGHIMAVIVGTDTTKSRQAEENAKHALMDAYEAARRANSAKSDFLSRMSHDIRTPINAIIGMTAIAGTHLDDTDRVTDCLNKITVSSGHLLSLINEVLDMSKIESGKADLNEEEFNLSDLVDALISMVRPQIKAKNQNLKVCIRNVVHEKVIGDKLRIQQSFLNLASNAVKYTPEGGNIKIGISETTRENALRILNELGMNGECVSDGESAVKKVIDRHNAGENFFAALIDWKMPGMDGIRVTKEIRRKVGHEVPIVIISASDWSDIELEARAAGADAFVSKPLFTSKLARLFREMTSGGTKPDSENDMDNLKNTDFSGKRVLLAEDNELNTEIAVELLEMTGLEVECAENGRKVVDKFAASEQGYYDLVFMDIQMPIMNGNEAARAIRALNRRDAKGVPIVAMTANAFNDDVQASMNAGMNEHISKPLDLKVLVKTLSKWLD